MDVVQNVGVLPYVVCKWHVSTADPSTDSLGFKPNYPSAKGLINEKRKSLQLSDRKDTRPRVVGSSAADMPRNLQSASSSTSEAMTSQANHVSDETSAFSVWKLIKRKTDENAFCLTSKFRMNRRIHRISDATVTRSRRDDNDHINDLHDSDSSSATDISKELEQVDDEDDDLEDLYNMLTDQPSMKTAASSILAMTRMIAITRQNSGADALVVEELLKTGTRAQKIYLKKCEEFGAAFSKRFLRSLITFSASIAHQCVGNRGIEACVVSLTQTSTVTVLNVSDNNIGPRGAKYLAMLLKDKTSITDLNVSDNKLGSRGARYLTDVIGDTDRLTRFDISNNCLQEKDAAMFRQMLEDTRKLKYLNLCQNGFRLEGGVILGEALSYNDGLEELNLGWNHLRLEGAAGLAEGLLENTSLKILDLSWNGFYLEGCRVLERTLVHNNTLLTLDLTNNRINRECIDHLTRGLAKNRTLRNLILKLNPLTSDGAYDILQFINECPTTGIQFLDLGLQQVDAGFQLLLTELLIQRRSIEVIYGEVIGRRVPVDPQFEQDILKEHAALVLIEYANLMGFRLIDLFASLDRTGSRTIDKGELILGLKLAGIPFAEPGIKRLATKLDLSRDGQIDVREIFIMEKEYDDQEAAITQTLEENDGNQLNTIPIWRIRTKLRRLVVDRLTDFNKFKKVSDQLTKQINSVIDAKADELEQEEERRRIKESRSQSIPGIPTSTPKRLRRIHAQPIPKVGLSTPGSVGDGMGGIDSASVIRKPTQTYTDYTPSSTERDTGIVKIGNHAKPRTLGRSIAWEAPNTENDAETSDSFPDQEGAASSGFGRITDKIHTMNAKVNDKVMDDDDKEDSDELGGEAEVMESHDRISSVSTASKTFRRNTIGTLKLGSHGDHVSKR